ncbi:zinc finger BED domain-containing protein 4-like [Rhizophagus clarus]|uniref:Zinc finger BED domain-containing protein 4-like n=1 Tax=Rhizophagus clarus TaxID=94130 RepID=A0A8H3M401_9GLOM|nr:zinc finger BED domain-containing protein 4-like [Rhizophagus clarus]
MAKVEGTHDNSDTEIKQPNQKRIKLNERHRGIEEVVGKECRKTYKIRTSTSNCSDHFANIHGITQEHEEVNVNQNQNIKDAFSKVTHHQESRQLKLCQHFTDWIICDSQPLTLLIMEKLEKDANAISLTCDLWTGCNRQGFLGITCSYLNPEFQLHEIILSVQYILYPHIADHIGDTLLAVLDEWELQDKTFMITTDNGSNMQKAIKDLELAADNIMPTHYSL